MQLHRIDRLPSKRRIGRDVPEYPPGGKRGEDRRARQRVRIGGLRDVDRRLLAADPDDQPEPWGQREILARADADIVDGANDGLGRRTEPVAARGRLVEAEAAAVEMVVEEPDESRRGQPGDPVIGGDVAGQIVAFEAAAERRRAGRLVDDAAVEGRLGSPRRGGREIMFVARAKDRAAIVAGEIALRRGLRDPLPVAAVDEDLDRSAARRGGRRPRAALLIGIGQILIVGKPRRQPEFAGIVDQLRGDPVVRPQHRGGERVDRGGAIVAMPGRALAADDAAEHAIVDPVVAMPERRIDVAIAVAADIGADVETVDITAAAGAEIDRAPERVVAVARRRRPANHVDSAIGVRIGEVEARQAVGLGYREVVLEHLDVARTEAVARVGPANRQPDVARAVALDDRHAGRQLDEIRDRGRGHPADRAVVDRGGGLAGRLRGRGERLRGDDDVAARLPALSEYGGRDERDRGCGRREIG